MSIFHTLRDWRTYKFGGYQNAKENLEAARNFEGDDFNPYAFIDSSDYRNNKKGRAQYQEDLAELLYLGQLIGEDRMNEYNSPVEQAKRMREAGLNPDLIGVENMPAANIAGYSANPMDGIPTTSESISNTIGIIANVMTMATGLMNAVGTFNAQSISNLAGVLGNSQTFLDMVSSSPNSGSITYFLESLPNLTKSQKRKLKQLHGQYVGSPRFKKGSLNFIADYNDSVGRFNKSTYNPYNMPIDGLTEEEFAYIWKPFIEAQTQAAKDVLQSGKKLEYDTQGAYENARGSKQENDLFDSFKGAFIKTFDRLDDLGPKGEFIKSCLAAVILGLGGL